MEVNGVIFKELVKRGCSYEGKNAVWNLTDPKLRFLTKEQADAYNALLGNEENYLRKMIDEERLLFEDEVSGIVEKIDSDTPLNVIDAGCSTGERALPLLKYLSKKAKIRYCPIDVNQALVSAALEKVKGLGMEEVIDFRWNVADFDSLDNVASLLNKDEFKRNLFLFLGSKLNVFEFHEMMYNFSSAMDTSSDYLLLGAALKLKSNEEMMKDYKTKINDDFFSILLTELGIDRKDIEMDVRCVNNRIELYYRLLRDRVIGFGDKRLGFRKGDLFLVTFSIRYELDELKDKLELYFSETDLFVNDEKSWALVLCKK